ncbi:sialate O-acetylesterase [Humisphaera borealis]|uniref:Sialate O-acetylesterase n=1 Tax=Humisphaera borealis TaxID=2807512 RepID=A0A7M2WTN7_9BACT|nr:sialate O-acetylesterase [Humisphaera borealis]QOV88522.1 sialate O-acetylesterase [Humisphaera borealis]
MFISRHFAHIVASLASLLIVASAGAAEFKPPAKAKFKLFLLVGQSNMAGRGTVEDQDKKPHPRVVTLNKEGKWVPAVDPIHFDKPTMTGVGLGTTFGKVVAEANPDDIIGLIPCAFGGTSIAQWSPDKPDGLYADAIKRAGVAMKDGTLAGILWHQGEADSKKTDTYAASVGKLFAAFRKDLHSPDVPVVVGLLGEFFAGKDAINTVLSDLPKSIPHLAVADSKGLEHKGDKVHFNAAAYREFGKRYAAQWMKLAATDANKK